MESHKVVNIDNQEKITKYTNLQPETHTQKKCVLPLTSRLINFSRSLFWWASCKILIRIKSRRGRNTIPNLSKFIHKNLNTHFFARKETEWLLCIKFNTYSFTNSLICFWWSCGSSPRPCESLASCSTLRHASSSVFILEQWLLARAVFFYSYVEDNCQCLETLLIVILCGCVATILRGYGIGVLINVSSWMASFAQIIWPKMSIILNLEKINSEFVV